MEKKERKKEHYYIKRKKDENRGSRHMKRNLSKQGCTGVAQKVLKIKGISLIPSSVMIIIDVLLSYENKTDKLVRSKKRDSKRAWYLKMIHFLRKSHTCSHSPQWRKILIFEP